MLYMKTRLKNIPCAYVFGVSISKIDALKEIGDDNTTIFYRWGGPGNFFVFFVRGNAFVK